MANATSYHVIRHVTILGSYTYINIYLISTPKETNNKMNNT